ncbi:MAG TPA: hypothetical protein VJ806_08155 [Luteimonas sp.]|nr:hypothetical protein [Luteimonas sp.]
MKKLEHAMSSRRDFRIYLLLIFGLVFVYAGATVDPATNCDESGRECAPWLVPIAFGIGVLATLGGMLALVRNRKWGSRLDLAGRRLSWWDSAVSADARSVSLDDVAKVVVNRRSESSDKVFIYRKDGERLDFPEENSVPYHPETWARDLAAHFPHIEVLVDE